PTHPSPHEEAAQVPLTQRPPLHGSHMLRGVPAAQAWPVCPPTVTIPQTSVPLQAFASGQVSGAVVHENLQLASQPVLGPLLAPKSQSSPSSFMPLPHVAAAQLPFTHVEFGPHCMPSCAGSAAGAQTWFASHAAI